MNATLGYIACKYGLDLYQDLPIGLPGVKRPEMAALLAEVGFKVGAEIGVAQGHHSKLLCEQIDGLELYCVDVWDLYDGYNEYQDRIHKYYREAQERLKDFNVHFVRKFSMDAVKDFADNSLDFVYIDGAHDFKNVAMDVCEWSRKVRPGGIVFGHDYKRTYDKYVVQVMDVIQAFMYSFKIRPWFVLETGRNASWMFVRQEGDLCAAL